MLTVLLALATGLWIALRLIDKYLTDVYCSFGDIQHFDDAVKHKRRGRAVVIGASISGILTARVCAKYFDSVLLLDAEECTTDPTTKRHRVKQHNQLHLFLGLLHPALKAMFPSFETAFNEAGGKVVPPHPVSYKGTRCLQLPDAEKTGWPVRQLYISREALEALLRKLVLSTCSNVETRVGMAKGIVMSQDRKSVESVMVRSPDGQVDNVECAFVVDASGTTNGSIGWLKNAGFRAPEKVTYDPAIVYTCYTFHTTPATRAKFDAIKGVPRTWCETGHIGASLGSSHSAFLQMEDGKVRTMFQTFTGQDNDPQSVQDVEAGYAVEPYADWQREAIKLLCHAEEDDGAPAAVRSKVAIGLCYRVTYRARDMPVNLVPLGDTILRVNPIFGQGCAKSVVDALTLDRVLRHQDGHAFDGSFVAKFLDLHYKRTDPLWETTRVHDYAHPETTPCAGQTREWATRTLHVSGPLLARPLLKRDADSTLATSQADVDREQLQQQQQLQTETTPHETASDETGLPKTFQQIKQNLNHDVFKAITVRPFKYSNMSDVQSEVLSLLPRLASSPAATTAAAATDNDATVDANPIEAAQDLLVRAKTGTGKTLAFLVPAIEGRLHDLKRFEKQFRLDNPDARPHERHRAVAAYAKSSAGALVLSPTRELATQIANEAEALTKHLDDFGVQLFVGGASKTMQMRGFKRLKSNGIIVATPGRCIDLLESEPSVGQVLSQSRMLILDEADTLLDMGFADDIARISEHLPDVSQRQTFLFSATVSREIRQVARKSLKREHVFIDTVPADEVDTHLHIPQFVTVLDSAKDQILHVLRLLAQDQLLHARKAAEQGPGGATGKAIVFLPTTKMTEVFALLVSAMKAHLPWARNTNIIEIHSRKNQQQRTRASDNFRKSTSAYSILVTSDVSARGVDYPGVTRVIQVGVPSTRDVYIHRVGRTGRAGKQGRGDLVLLPFEKDFVKTQLHDIPFERIQVDDIQAELDEMAKSFDESPVKIVAPAPPSSDKSDRRRSSQSRAPAQIVTPVAPRLSTMSQSLSVNVLPTLDKISIEETFTSMLGYYMSKSGEMRTTKSNILEGCKEWTTETMELEEAPYVSPMLLSKMGVNKNEKSRRGGGDRRGAGFGRSSFRRNDHDSFSGGFSRDRDRGESRFGFSGGRGERDRNDGAPRWASRGKSSTWGRDRDRDDGPARRSSSSRTFRDDDRGPSSRARRRDNGDRGASHGFGASSSPWS
ncbi:hypothetical protein ACM66B_004339 [Microbotryomycetes sp. NB124-2]